MIGTQQAESKWYDLAAQVAIVFVLGGTAVVAALFFGLPRVVAACAIGAVIGQQSADWLLDGPMTVWKHLFSMLMIALGVGIGQSVGHFSGFIQ